MGGGDSLGPDSVAADSSGAGAAAVAPCDSVGDVEPTDTVTGIT